MLSQIHSGLRGVYNKDVPQQGRRSSGAKRCPLPRWPSANPPFGFWAALQTRPRSCDTAAGSWEASRRPSSPPWRPDTPLEAAPEEGDSSALLAASQRTQALPSAPEQAGLQRQRRPDTHAAGGEPDGGPEELPDTPMVEGRKEPQHPFETLARWP